MSWLDEVFLKDEVSHLIKYLLDEVGYRRENKYMIVPFRIRGWVYLRHPVDKKYIIEIHYLSAHNVMDDDNNHMGHKFRAWVIFLHPLNYMAYARL